MKLTSMTDFVSWIGNREEHESYEKDLALIYNYATFLKQPLKLEMFVPCDEDGNIWQYLPTKEEWEWAQKDSADAEQSFKQKEYYYEKAKEKVLFEGFKQKYVSQFEYQWGLILRLNTSGSIWFSFNDYTKESNDHVSIRTIEDLCIAHELKLTENALKQIGLKN